MAYKIKPNLFTFTPPLDKTYEENEMVLVKKKIYYKNIMLFVYKLESLVTF